MRYPLKNFPIKNSLKCFINNFILRRPIPLLLSLDVTKKCNARCPFCEFWKSVPSKDLPSDEIKKIFDSAYDLGCMIAVITGGEPLLRKDLPSILGYAKEASLTTFLLTNGYLLPERIHQIYENLDIVSVSIDFPDSRHDKTRGLNGLLNRAITGLSLAQGYDVATNINCIVTGRHSLEDIRRLLFLARRLNSGITFAPIVAFPDSYTPRAFIGRLSKEGEDLKMNDWNILRSVADMLLFYKKHGFRKIIQNTDAYLKLIRDRDGFTCFPSSLQVAVSSTGEVGSLCPIGLYKSYNLGNALKQDLKDIWYSERAEMLREKFKGCELAKPLGCYLLCVAELSLLFSKPTILFDYLRRLV